MPYSNRLSTRESVKAVSSRRESIFNLLKRQIARTQDSDLNPKRHRNPLTAVILKTIYHRIARLKRVSLRMSSKGTHYVHVADKLET